MVRKPTFEKFYETKNSYFFYLEHFIFNKYICKMYKLYNDLQLKIVEKQDLYRKKDDIRFFFNKKFL